MRSDRFSIAGFAGIGLLAATLIGGPATAAPVSVAVGASQMPFSNEDCTRGILISALDELFERANLEHQIRCMTTGRVYQSVFNNNVDVGVNMPGGRSDVFYTSKFHGFENVAITRTTDALTIDDIADLADISVIAWSDAPRVLGAEFAAIAASNPRYAEAGSQTAQVRKFLLGRAQAIVIDRNIFKWISNQLLQHEDFATNENDFTYHEIFENVHDHYIGTRDERLRDKLDDALISMRNDGVFERIRQDFLGL